MTNNSPTDNAKQPPFTLDPKPEHGVTRKDIWDQFKFFIDVAKKANISEDSGLSDKIAEAKAKLRWGSYEGALCYTAARRHPDRLGLVDDDGELTYEQLWEAANRLARGLWQRGIREGSRVAVLALNGRASILPLIARHLVGFNIFMVNANASASQIEHLLEYHEIDGIILDQEFVERLTEKSRHRLVIVGHVDKPNEMEEGLITLQDVIDSAQVTLELPFRPSKSKHIVMTSGTTGVPKGVVRRIPLSPQPAAPVLASIPWHMGMSVILTGVLFHAYGWAQLNMCFLTASTIVARRHFDAEQTFKDIDKYKVTAMASAATPLRALYRYAEENGIDEVEGMEFIVSSGSPLAPSEIEKCNKLFGRTLCNTYGSTETATLAMAGPEDLAGDPTLSGIVFPGTRIEIRDEEGNMVPDGESGEIWAGAYDMFLGYTDPSIDIPVNNGLIRMGDRGIRKGNRLYVQGRADDMVITARAEKIFPAELEKVLIGDPRINDSVVMGVKDGEFGQALRAYILPEEGEDSISEEEITTLLRETLSDAHVPRDIIFVDEFPRNPMGKVLRKQLPGLDSDN